MSSLGGNSFVFILVLYALVSWEWTTVAVAADTTLGLIPKTLVDLFNKLPNRESFTVHCKSKDNDLGSHIIGPGQKSEIKFSVNIFETTLFFCSVSWKGGHADFDIYKGSRDAEVRCPRYCRWEARGDAIVGYREEAPDPDIVVPWQK